MSCPAACVAIRRPAEAASRGKKGNVTRSISASRDPQTVSVRHALDYGTFVPWVGPARDDLLSHGQFRPLARKRDQGSQPCGNVAAARIIEAKVTEGARPVAKHAHEGTGREIGLDPPLRQVGEAQAIAGGIEHERGLV